MLCPYCQTENRDDRETCYHCSRDVSMLRLIVNRAKHHYNQALEHAERGRVDEAITDLNNALEVDSSIINAYVVLGTLYTRKEMFKEAREAWQQALAADHRFQKAHEYLLKAGQAEYAFPAVRRLRNLCLTLAAVSLALVIVLVLGTEPLTQLLAIPTAVLLIVVVWLAVSLGRSDPGRTVINQALSLPQRQSVDSLAAVTQLGELANRSDADEMVKSFAENLSRQIKAAWERRLEMGRKALREDAPHIAMDLANALIEQKPNDETLEAARSLHEQATAQLLEHVTRASKCYFDEGKGLDVFEREAERLLTRVNQGPAHTKVEGLGEQVHARRDERLIEAAGVAVTEGQLHESIPKLMEWKEGYPHLADRLEALVDQQLETEATMVEMQAGGLIEQRELKEAEVLLDELELIFKLAKRPAPTEMFESVTARIEEGRRQLAFEQSINAFEEERYEQFLEMITRPEELTDDPAELAKLETLRGEALRGWAGQMWDWFAEHGGEFEECEISSEDAKRAVEIHRRVIEHLPEDFADALAPILFYTASACFKLEEPERGKALIDEIARDHPDSHIMQSVHQFTLRFAKELGPFGELEGEIEVEEAPAGETEEVEEAKTEMMTEGVSETVTVKIDEQAHDGVEVVPPTHEPEVGGEDVLDEETLPGAMASPEADPNEPVIASVVGPETKRKDDAGENQPRPQATHGEQTHNGGAEEER